MRFGELQPSPRLPTTSGERRWVAFFVLVLAGLFLAEVASGYTTERLSILFVALFWGPALVLHELGHALAARLVGWDVTEIVIGFGKELTRFRVGRIKVRVRMLPVEGYVVPSPRDLRFARVKSALIYAAGPGAELLLILVLYWWQGTELFTPSQDEGQIAIQSAALACAIGAAFNLIPFPTSGGVSDGLGILLSLVAEERGLRARLVQPFVREAHQALYREAVEEASQRVEAGRQRDPDSWQLKGLQAVIMAAQGNSESAFEHLESLGHPDDKEPFDRAELLLYAAWTTLYAGERALLHQAQAACERALVTFPGYPRAHLLMGRVLLERGLPEDAYSTLMEGYSQTRDGEEEGQFIAYLAIACRRAGRGEYAQRFATQVSQSSIGPELRRRVDEELGASE